MPSSRGAKTQKKRVLSSLNTQKKLSMQKLYKKFSVHFCCLKNRVKITNSNIIKYFHREQTIVRGCLLMTAHNFGYFLKIPILSTKVVVKNSYTPPSTRLWRHLWTTPMCDEDLGKIIQKGKKNTWLEGTSAVDLLIT